MSASSILQLIQKRGKPPVANPSAAGSTNLTVSSNRLGGVRSSATTHDLHGSRPVDPVVAQLKEKRRLENEKKEAELRLKKGLAPKSAKPLKSASSPSKKKSVEQSSTLRPKIAPNAQSKQPHRPIVTPSSMRPPAKKMNFNELMKKASTIDNSKLSISLKNKSKSPEAIKPVSRNAKIPQKNVKSPQNIQGPPLSISKTKGKHPPNGSRPQPRPPVRPTERRAPLPIRQPSSKLQERLGSKTQNTGPKSVSRDQYESEDDDDDMDSFIASSEEEELARDSRAGPDYDRDEIWAIFNRGKKRTQFNDDDYDSDDMEASGSQILQEEQLSRRRAELEDREEMENERRLAELKRARKRHM